MPFFDYPVQPDFLLTFAGLVLGVISLVFSTIIAIGPIGRIVLVLLPVGLFCREIFAGPKAFRNAKS